MSADREDPIKLVEKLGLIPHDTAREELDISFGESDPLIRKAPKDMAPLINEIVDAYKNLSGDNRAAVVLLMCQVNAARHRIIGGTGKEAVSLSEQSAIVAVVEGLPFDAGEHATTFYAILNNWISLNEKTRSLVAERLAEWSLLSSAKLRRVSDETLTRLFEVLDAERRKNEA